MMIKSAINSQQIKNLIHNAVDKGLEACAQQQESNSALYEGVNYENLMRKDYQHH